MKRIALTFLLLCACALSLTTRVSFATEPEASGIFGVAKFVVGANSIQVTKDDSLPYELDLIPGSRSSEASVKSLAINVGDSFIISDRHHANIAYRLLKITSDAALIEEVSRTHFPGRKEQKNTRTVLIRTYGIDISNK